MFFDVVARLETSRIPRIQCNPHCHFFRIDQYAVLAAHKGQVPEIIVTVRTDCGHSRITFLLQEFTCYSYRLLHRDFGRADLAVVNIRDQHSAFSCKVHADRLLMVPASYRSRK
ncbi:hypothetical protein D3C87_1728940 [compost metagenome]